MSAFANFFYMYFQQTTWQDWRSESRAIDADEVDITFQQASSIGYAIDDARDLRHGFENEYAWEYGSAWEVSLEPRVAGGDSFYPDP